MADLSLPVQCLEIIRPLRRSGMFTFSKQIWKEKNYGLDFLWGEDNDFASSVSQTEDGGYIIAGTTEGYVNGGSPHSFLLR